MSEIVYMVGLPCAGKSTHIKKFYRKHTVVSFDTFIEKIAKVAGCTYNEAFDAIPYESVIDMMKAAICLAAEKDKEIVIDNTNLSPESRAMFDDCIPAYYRQVAVVFIVPLGVIEDRMSKRGDKIVSPERLEELANSATFPIYEGFAEIQYRWYDDHGRLERTSIDRRGCPFRY